ncbi:troponin T, skeletal muscle-like [Gossypium australe]|uniref:Troponin T, skeletal muscle-like n=1 Tax=Gossypium australe TaxID=47621 RepID=A0A5B6VBA3_9ROSI|nr:troponin T, skeletal muscle-like [Gossypium australe]
MGDIKRQIGTGIPSNTEENLRREDKEHVKAIALRSDKVLYSLKPTTLETIVDNNDNPHEKHKISQDSKEVIISAVETEKEVTKDYTGIKSPFPSRLEEKKK